MTKFRKILYYTACTLLAICFLATVLPFIGNLKEWYAQIFDFPRLQILSAALIAVIIFTFFFFFHTKKSWIALLGCILIIGYQGYKVFPYTKLASEQTALSEKAEGEAPRVSFLISNVLMKNTEYHKLQAEIEKYDPDIVILLEPDQKWADALRSTMSEYKIVSEPIPNTYGMILYSKLTLTDTEIKYQVEDDIPSIFTKVTKESLTFQLYCIHPRPPFPTESKDSEERDAEIILTGKIAKEQTLPVVVAGDFNDVAWSDNTKLFQKSSQLLDPRVGRGFYTTFNANNFLLRWPLDHLFHSSEFMLVDMKILENIGSDHFPIYVELSYEPENAAKSNPEKEDKNTDEKANKVIKDGKEDTKK